MPARSAAATGTAGVVPKYPDTFSSPITVSIERGMIQLIHARDNRPPKTEECDASDEGIAALVAALIAGKSTDRMTFDLSRTNTTKEALDDLKKLHKLTFVSLPEEGISQKAIDAFRMARPDVDVHLEPLRVNPR
jgi:hypothetical protein